jgi:hypothetical protein
MFCHVIPHKRAESSGTAAKQSHISVKTLGQGRDSKKKRHRERERWVATII